MMYRQCILQSGKSQQTAWLPTRHGGKEVTIGTVVTLKGEDDREWTVAGQYGHAQNEEYFVKKRAERAARLSTVH